MARSTHPSVFSLPGYNLRQYILDCRLITSTVRELRKDFSPEQLLQLAVLAEAISELHGPYPQSAEKWVFQECWRNDPYSFQGISASLGLDAAWMRAKLSKQPNRSEKCSYAQERFYSVA